MKPEQEKLLAKPFEAGEHKFKQTNVYIDKSAIRRRLSEVDPQWGFTTPEFVCVDGDVVIMRGGLTVCGVTRYQIGSGIIQRKDDKGVELTGYGLALSISNAYKSAATSVLARAAVEFNCGAYLKDLSKDERPKNMDALKKLLERLNPTAGRQVVDPDAWTIDSIRIWGNKWRALGMTDKELQKALNLSNTQRWTDFKGTLSEADKAVEAFRSVQEAFSPTPKVVDVQTSQPTTSEPMSELKKQYGTRAMLECDAKFLELDDILIHQDQGGKITYSKVIVAPIWSGGTFPYKLTVKHLETDTDEVIELGGVAYQRLVAGPKCKAYMDNPRLAHESGYGSIPIWDAKTVETDDEVAPIVGKLPTVMCKTSQLVPGDVFKQSGHNDRGRQQTLIKVLTNPEKRNRNYWFRSKNFSTTLIGDFSWADVDVAVIAGPKCEAYMKDHSVCIEGAGEYPFWRGELVTSS